MPLDERLAIPPHFYVGSSLLVIISIGLVYIKWYANKPLYQYLALCFERID